MWQPEESNTAMSDDWDLRRRVANYLLGCQMPGLRNIEIKTEGGTVVLSGRVRSFYEKQLCIHCCRRVAGVRKLVDLIEVGSASHVPQSA